MLAGAAPASNLESAQMTLSGGGRLTSPTSTEDLRAGGCLTSPTSTEVFCASGVVMPPASTEHFCAGGWLSRPPGTTFFHFSLVFATFVYYLYLSANFTLFNSIRICRPNSPVFICICPTNSNVSINHIIQTSI